jgi:hypothetical protein
MAPTADYYHTVMLRAEPIPEVPDLDSAMSVSLDSQVEASESPDATEAAPEEEAPKRRRYYRRRDLQADE